MSVSRVKVWAAGEVLTASDLNAEFNNVISNGQDLGSPRTKALDMDGQQLIIDADADSYLVEDSDDVIKLRLQGVDLFYWDGDATSPVNGLTFTASATTVAPNISATGTDTNIGVTVKPKGTGAFSLTLNGVADLMKFDGNVASPVNGLTFAPAATGSAASIAAAGTDSNIDVALTPKGNGYLSVGGTKGRIGPVGSIWFAFAVLTGTIALDGRTIGDASSGADHASADFSNLYTHLWGALANSEAAVSSGRGASAAADFAAHKTLTLPDFSGRVPGGLDNMSGTSRDIVVSATADTAGKKMGEETHQLITAELASHTHTQDAHTHTNSAAATFVIQEGAGATETVWATSGTTAFAINNATATNQNTGSGTAHNNMQPTIWGYWVIAY